MTEAYKPGADELGFRQRLLADAATMSYNAAWGGTIPFPREKWEGWARDWLEAPETLRYYRYLRDTESGDCVGEIAYRYDGQRRIHLCDVIVLAARRNRGYGTAGIRLLCRAAKARGISVLYDDIAADNPSRGLFLKNGFVIDRQDDDVILVRKEL